MGRSEIASRLSGDFRLLLAGSSVSMLGSRITVVAYPLLVLAITRSPLTTGWSTFAVIAPSVLVYLPAGALVDRWDPRRVMFASELGRGVAIASIAIQIVLGSLSLPALIVAAATEQTLEVFSVLAEQRFSRSLVKPERPEQAASALVRSETRNHLAVLLGRPIGALLFGIAWVLPFALDAFTFFVSLTALFRIRNGRAERTTVRHVISEINHMLRVFSEWMTSFFVAVFPFTAPMVTHAMAGNGRLRERVTASPMVGDVGAMLADIGDGFGWLRSNPFACTGLFLTAGTTFVSQALIMVFFAEASSQSLPSMSIGIVLAASGAGGVAGSAMGSRLFRHFKYRLLQLQMVIWAVMFGFLAFAGSPSYWHIAIAIAVLGFAGAAGNISINTYLALHAGPRLARVLSFYRLTSFTALALGPALGGALVANLGVRSAVRWLFAPTLLLVAVMPVAGIVGHLRRHRQNRGNPVELAIPGTAVPDDGGSDPAICAEAPDQSGEFTSRETHIQAKGKTWSFVALPLHVVLTLGPTYLVKAQKLHDVHG